MRTFSLVFAMIVLVLAPVSFAQSKCDDGPICGPYSEDPGDSCMGPDDPFCDFTGGHGDYPSWCFICSQELKCIIQDEGKTGRETCTQKTEGIIIVDCWTSDDFCENITVGP